VTTKKRGDDTVANEKPDETLKSPDKASGNPQEARLENSGRVAVSYGDLPPKRPAVQNIHPRRPLPDVAEPLAGDDKT
jgi:hypothetical protein